MLETETGAALTAPDSVATATMAAKTLFIVEIRNLTLRINRFRPLKYAAWPFARFCSYTACKNRVSSRQRMSMGMLAVDYFAAEGVDNRSGFSLARARGKAEPH